MELVFCVSSALPHRCRATTAFPRTACRGRWGNWPNVWRSWNVRESSWRGIWETANTVQRALLLNRSGESPVHLWTNESRGRSCLVSVKEEERMLLEWFCLHHARHLLVRRDAELCHLWVDSTGAAVTLHFFSWMLRCLLDSFQQSFLMSRCRTMQQTLEERQADVEYELRCLLNKQGECASALIQPWAMILNMNQVLFEILATFCSD